MENIYLMFFSFLPFHTWRPFALSLSRTHGIYSRLNLVSCENHLLYFSSVAFITHTHLSLLLLLRRIMFTSWFIKAHININFNALSLSACVIISLSLLCEWYVYAQMNPFVRLVCSLLVFFTMRKLSLGFWCFSASRERDLLQLQRNHLTNCIQFLSAENLINNSL